MPMMLLRRALTTVLISVGVICSLIVLTFGGVAVAQTLGGDRLSILRTFNTIFQSTDANTAVVSTTVLEANQNFEYASVLADMNCVPTQTIVFTETRPLCVALHFHSNIMPSTGADTWEQRALMGETRNWGNYAVETGIGAQIAVETTPGATGKYKNARAYVSYINARGGPVEKAVAFESREQVNPGSVMGPFTHFLANPPEVNLGIQGSNVGFQADNCVATLASPCKAFVANAGVSEFNGPVYLLANGQLKLVTVGAPNSCGNGQRCLTVGN